MQPTREQIRSAPKVLLHDHLDGGLRPQTLLELADLSGHVLPADTADALGEWCVRTSSAGTLAGYLEPFRHTVAVMQTAAALTRVAHEAVLDLAADGVVHAEVRWAPELHQARGLTLDEAVAAVAQGFASGEAEAGSIRVAQLLTSIRDGDRASEVAALALAWRDRGVVGFDLAGDEAGHPASDHAEAFARLRQGPMRYTIHAGESAGVDSVLDALVCGTSRLGHGVRLAQDIRPDGTTGRVASYVRDTGIPLEVCPTSNVQTGAVASLAEHPGGRLHGLGFRVTVNTDNRLMSGTTTTDELVAAATTFGWDLADLEAVSVVAAEASFLAYDDRVDLVSRVREGWERVRTRAPSHPMF